MHHGSPDSDSVAQGSEYVVDDAAAMVGGGVDAGIGPGSDAEMVAKGLEGVDCAAWGAGRARMVAVKAKMRTREECIVTGWLSLRKYAILLVVWEVVDEWLTVERGTVDWDMNFTSFNI